MIISSRNLNRIRASVKKGYSNVTVDDLTECFQKVQEAYQSLKDENFLENNPHIR